MVIKILNKLFYNPNIFAKKRKNIILDNSTILLKSCVFRFEGSLKKNIVKIGSNSMIGCALIFETDTGKIEIGNNTFINGKTKLISKTQIKIGNFVTIAWGCTIYDHNSHSLDYRERQKDITRQNQDYRDKNHFTKSKDWSMVKSKPIIIQDNVWIGFDCVILAGVIIGEGAIVGARSVVRENVAPWTVVAGNPAKFIKNVTHE